MKNSDNTMTSIDFRLEWRSEDAIHTEGFFGQEINVWRDCLPMGIYEALQEAGPGDAFHFQYNPGEIVAPHQRDRIFTIKQSQFDRCGRGDVMIEPHGGRYYPKGILRDIPNVFRANIEPFRCGDVSETGITVDFNHPLANRKLAVKVSVRDVWAKTKERGGTCNAWLDRLTEGPGMQVRWNGRPTEFFSQNAFRREDPTIDSDFYGKPRFVQHIDSQAKEVIRNVYSRLLKPHMDVLDLMSSWESHLPEELALGDVVGLGLNQAELDANPRLKQGIVQDLNAHPVLPFADGSFDAVLCSVSVEYLLRPFDVFSEIARVLKPDGLLAVTFSNRWFPTKAIQVWRETHELERLGVVMEYFLHQERFDRLETFSMRGLPRPENDKYYGTFWVSDPVYAVWGRRATADASR